MVKTYRIAKKSNYKHIVLSSVATLALGGFVGYIAGYQQGKQNMFFEKYGDVRLETKKADIRNETPKAKYKTDQFDMDSIEEVSEYVMFEKWVAGKVPFKQLKSVKRTPLKGMINMFREEPKYATLEHAIKNKYFDYKVFANKYATAVIDPYLKKKQDALINVCLRQMGEGKPSKFVIADPQSEVEKLRLMWIAADESDIISNQKKKYFLRKEKIDLLLNYVAAEFDLKGRKQQLSQMNPYGEKPKQLFSLYNYLVGGPADKNAKPKMIAKLLHEHTGKEKIGRKFITHYQKKLADKYNLHIWMVASLNKSYYTEKEVEALHKIIEANPENAIINYILPALEEANKIHLASKKRRTSPLAFRINYLLDDAKQMYIDEVHKQNKNLRGIERYSYESAHTNYVKTLLKNKDYRKAKHYLDIKQVPLRRNEQWVLAKLKSKEKIVEERIEAWDLFYDLFSKGGEKNVSYKEKICRRMLPLVKDVRGTSSKYDSQIEEVHQLALEMRKSESRRNKIKRINSRWADIEHDAIRERYANKLLSSLSDRYERELYYLDDTLMMNMLESSFTGKHTTKYQEMLTTNYLKQIGKRADRLHEKDAKILCLIADSGEAYGIRSIQYLSKFDTKNNEAYLPQFVEAYNTSQKHYSARMLVSSFNNTLNKINTSNLEEQVYQEKMEMMQGYINSVKKHDQHNIWYKLQTAYDTMDKSSLNQKE